MASPRIIVLPPPRIVDLDTGTACQGTGDKRFWQLAIRVLPGEPLLAFGAAPAHVSHAKKHLPRRFRNHRLDVSRHRLRQRRSRLAARQPSGCPSASRLNLTCQEFAFGSMRNSHAGRVNPE